MRGDYKIRITMRLSVLVIVGLLPFVSMHLYLGNWPIASLLIFIMVGESLFVLYLRQGGQDYWPHHLVAATYTAGTLFVIHTMGITGTYWLYPVLLSNFFILPLKSALTLNLGATAAAGLLMIHDPAIALRLLSAMGIMIAFGYVFSRQIEKQQQELKSMSYTDALTGILNRRALDRDMEYEIKYKQRHAVTTSLIIMDLDRFKLVNDQFGHHEGDLMIQQVADRLKSRLRATDGLYRFGGDELVVIARHTTLSDATKLARSLNEQVHDVQAGGIHPVTLSAGVAELMADETAYQWLQRADLVLNQAKAEGRDRVLSDAPKVGPAT